MKPKYPLAEVEALIREYRAGRMSALAFSAPGASIKRITRVFSCSESEAADIAIAGVLKLDEESFSRSFVQWEMVVDEYGLEGFMGHNWYVKLAIVTEDEDRLLDEISFHPLEKPMKVNDGRALEVTYAPREGRATT